MGPTDALEADRTSAGTPRASCSSGRPLSAKEPRDALARRTIHPCPRVLGWVTFTASPLLVVHGSLQLRLVHARAALDAEVARLLIELFARASARPGFARAMSAAAA